MSAEDRLPPNPAARDQRCRHDRVDHPVGGTRRPRGVIGPSHLPEDLGLTQDLGVESGSDFEQMAHRLLAVETKQCLADVGAPAQREVAEPRLEVEVAGPIDLAAIAGGEEERGTVGRGLALEPCGDFSRGEGETLPQLDPGRMMAHANDMEGQVPEHGR
jgi:hypothetical protein